MFTDATRGETVEAVPWLSAGATSSLLRTVPIFSWKGITGAAYLRMRMRLSETQIACWDDKLEKGRSQQNEVQSANL